MGRGVVPQLRGQRNAAVADRPQLALPSVLEEETRARDAALTAYAVRYRPLYMQYACAIAPDLSRWEDVWDRLAFSILTANAMVHDAVTAFHQARQSRRGVGFHGIAGMTPNKARYLNALPCGRPILRYRKRKDEGWLRYRMRLMTIDGLGVTKASYAACLLYPLEAEVACLDTWMQKLLLGSKGFEWLTVDEYILAERRLARWARTVGINLALAQWIAWDWMRGDGPSPQRYFDA